MTAGEAITRLDELEPNQFTQAQKLRWLSNLDGRLFEELVKTHEDPIRESFTAYTATTDELLVPEPYADGLYNWYLQAMIAAENSEDASYEQLRVRYNDALRQFGDWYNRTHRPKGGARFWF